MIIKKILIVLISTMSLNAFAYRERNYVYDKERFVLSLNLGPAYSRPGETQTVYYQLEPTTYVPLPQNDKPRLNTTAQGTRAQFVGEVFAGFVGYINSVVEGQIGLAVGGDSAIKLRGTIWNQSSPFLRFFNYDYKVVSKRIALKGKALYTINPYDLYPYISGSAGVALNNSSGFAINPYLPDATSPLLNPGPYFSDRNATGFTWSLGTGIEAALDDGWRVGLGFEFTEWGSSSLGPAIGQLIGKGLGLKSLRSHEFLLSLSHLS